MKAPIWDNPVLGGAARLMGYIRNDAPINMVRQAADDLAAGVPLLVFPEGTRTRRKPVNAFKGGFALIAKRAGAPIQTVFIETDNPFLSKGWPLFKKPTFPSSTACGSVRHSPSRATCTRSSVARAILP
jgi:1-acyl-sn-glycerol-3-phosphate acyltransferase